MKLFTKILVVLCVISIPFSVLYFVKPRVITKRETVERIVNITPDSTRVHFKPTKPDSFTKADTLGERYVVSRKTFNKKYLYKGEEIANVESKVSAYGEMKAELLENEITITPNKYNLKEMLMENTEIVRSEVSKRSFRKGLIIGCVSTAAVIVGGMLLVRRK